MFLTLQSKQVFVPIPQMLYIELFIIIYFFYFKNSEFRKMLSTSIIQKCQLFILIFFYV